MAVKEAAILSQKKKKDKQRQWTIIIRFYSLTLLFDCEKDQVF